jgi:hypothetical protein
MFLFQGTTEKNPFIEEKSGKSSDMQNVPVPTNQAEPVSKKRFMGYWVRNIGTPSYNAGDNPTQEFFSDKDEWSGINYHCWYHNANVKVKDGKLIFDGEHGKEEYFQLKDVVRNPSQTASWRIGISDIESGSQGHSLAEIVANLSSTKPGDPINKKIVEDIVRCVPLEYFQGPKEKNITDKQELSKTLTLAQMGRIIQYYTYAIPLEKGMAGKDAAGSAKDDDVMLRGFKKATEKLSVNPVVVLPSAPKEQKNVKIQ